MPDAEITRGYVPGALGRIVSLHGTYYHEHWGFGAFFESQVATDLAEFVQRYDPARDGLWTASVKGSVEGSIAVDGVQAVERGAHLRWFIVSGALRGTGVGSRLIRSAMDFCRGRDYPRVYLWTFSGLDAARHLYEREGFVLVEERHGDQWGTEVLEQKWECPITKTPGA